MVIVVDSLTDPNDSYIYEGVVDVSESIDGTQFTVYKPNREAYRFDCDKYSWHELTADEAMARGIYTKENENLKYKLTVDDSGYGMNCTNCERIIFIKPKAGDSVEVSPDKLSELDWININGIKFMRENGPRECKTKNIKFYFNRKEIPFEELSEIPQRTTDRKNHTRTEIVLNYIDKDAIFFYTKTEHYTVADGADEEEYYEEM